ncbi:MAG: PspC domain-containing protein [Lawsonibacter sp.]|nr:PspC domain-containing protein [Lawsonibacter sp.]
MDKKKLYRTEDGCRMLCGVCGGLAEYFDVDPTLVRVGWVIASFFTFSVGFWAYLICAVIMPKKSDIYPGY